MSDMPTARAYLRGPDLSVYCRACLHRAYADMQALVDVGHGDTPLIQLKFKCSACGSDDIGRVVTGTRYGVNAAAADQRPPPAQDR